MATATQDIMRRSYIDIVKSTGVVSTSCVKGSEISFLRMKDTNFAKVDFWFFFFFFYSPGELEWKE